MNLFNYTKRETALERILYEKQIKFGFLGNTNDPGESKTWYHPLMIPNELIGKDSDRLIRFTLPVHEIVKEVMMKEWKVFCLTKDCTYNRKRGGLNEFFKDPQRFMDTVASIIKFKLHNLLVDGIM